MLAPVMKILFQSMSFIGIYFTVKLLYESLNKWKSGRRKGAEDDDPFHKVIFFPDEGIVSLRRRESTSPPKGPADEEAFFKGAVLLAPNARVNLEQSTSLLYLLKFIASANRSLDLCILIFTLRELGDAVIEAKKRGIHVRVIVDKSLSDCDGSRLPMLQKENIPVVRGPPGVMVHHKFALADASFSPGTPPVSPEEGESPPPCRGVVATGSFNWTWGAVHSNLENMIITDNPEIVGPFRREFERLWGHFTSPSSSFSQGGTG